MKTKKLLSILLALMMMLSVVPFYASAAPIALTATHVTEWPIAEGEIYYGQTVSEGITLTGGKVVYNGEEVPGKFVHYMDSFRPLQASDASKANLKFVPEDETAYKGFNKLMSNTTFVVKKTTPVLKDENDSPVATSVKAGQMLSESNISGGIMINPYNPSETSVQSAVWQWTYPDIELTESGEYEAYLQGKENSYEKVTKKIYVEVESDVLVTEVATLPTIDSFTYNPNTKWGSVAVNGGSVIVKGTDTEVEGTFSISSDWLNAAPSAGDYEVEVIFTPNDTTKYLGLNLKVPTTVNPAPISFGSDFNGTSIDDPFVYEVTPGTLMRDVLNGVKKYINYPPQSVFIIEDANYAAQNGRTYKITVIHDNTNYVGSEAYVKTVFKTVELTPTFKPGHLSSAIDCGKYSPAGTFTVTLDGKEIATVKANEEFTYTVENSGEYVLGAKYNPVENDYFIVADATQTVDVKLKRLVNRINCTSNGGLTVLYGDTVELSANATIETLDRWVITDASGNEVDLGIDLTQLNISFTMPDFNITAEAKLKGASSGDGTDEPSGGLDDIFGDLTEGDSDSPIVNIFNNILAWFRNLIETIKNFFRGIGNVS